VVTLINQERQARGLPPVSVHAALTQAAASHSTDMACNHFFSHTGSDGSAPWDRAVRFGYSASAIGEIIYMGTGSYGTPSAAVQGWLNSEGHRAIMLDSIYQHIGVGVVYDPNTGTTYFTAVFGRP